MLVENAVSWLNTVEVQLPEQINRISAYKSQLALQTERINQLTEQLNQLSQQHPGNSFSEHELNCVRLRTQVLRQEELIYNLNLSICENESQYIFLISGLVDKRNRERLIIDDNTSAVSRIKKIAIASFILICAGVAIGAYAVFKR